MVDRVQSTPFAGQNAAQLAVTRDTLRPVIESLDAGGAADQSPRVPEGEEEEVRETPQVPQVQVQTDEPEFEGSPTPQIQNAIDAPSTQQIVRDLVGEFFQDNIIEPAGVPPPATVPDDAGAQLQVAIDTTPAPPPSDTAPPTGTNEPLETLGGSRPDPAQEPIFAEPSGAPPPNAVVSTSAPEVQSLGGGEPAAPEPDRPAPEADNGPRGVVVDVVA